MVMVIHIHIWICKLFAMFFELSKISYDCFLRQAHKFCKPFIECSMNNLRYLCYFHIKLYGTPMDSI